MTPLAFCSIRVVVPVDDEPEDPVVVPDEEPVVVPDEDEPVVVLELVVLTALTAVRAELSAVVSTPMLVPLLPAV